MIAEGNRPARVVLYTGVQMKKLFLVAAVALTLVGCGHLSSSGEPDLGGYLGRFENRPAKVEGTLGSAPSLADWSTVPVC